MKKWVSLDQWLKNWDRLSEEEILTEIYENLNSRYTNSQRHYHNLDHINKCLEEFYEITHLSTHSFEVWLALWFHDAVYDPKGKDNEKASSEYAVKVLDKLLEKESVNRISCLILSTKHDAQANSIDDELVMDIDLAILGSKRDFFDEYEESIRKEYAWVPEDRFREGRVSILMGFLERDSIYQTDYFRQKYEKVARQNLHHSISRLKKGD